LFLLFLIFSNREPVVVLFASLALMAIFKSYPSIGDVGFYLSLVPLLSHVLPSIRQVIVTFGLFAATLVLAPVLWHLWLYDGSANANFFFAINLFFAAAQILLVSDLLFAHMRREYELVHGARKDKKSFLLTLR
jgi:phosphatidylinositol glycan class U